MKSKSLIPLACLFLLCGSRVQADEIVLKDGREFSGKLVRADAKIVEFRVQDKIESFNTSDVSRIVFKEPELVSPGRGRVERAEEPKKEPVPLDAAATPEINRRVNLPADTPSTVSQRASITLPAGTPVIVRTLQQIDTDRNRVGETFEASLEEPLSFDGQIVAPRGSRVIGKIAYAEESGRVSGQSQLILELAELVLEGRSIPVRTTDHVEVGQSRGKRTAAAATGGAVVGAIIGAVAGGGKGAAIGAAAGAGAGTGIQVITGGQILKVPAETVLQFQLQKPLSLDAP